MDLCHSPQPSPLMVVTRHSRNKRQHLVFLGNDTLTEPLSQFLAKAKAKGDTVQMYPKKLRLDDTLFQVKISLFVHLSQPKEKRFLLLNNSINCCSYMSTS